MSGTKNDQGKAPMHFLTKEFLESVAKAQGFGAAKYGDYNFCKGIAYTRLLDAAMRHLTAFTWGEDKDPESGESHIGHCAANLNMLMFMIANHSELDDRYKAESKANERKLAEVEKIKQDSFDKNIEDVLHNNDFFKNKTSKLVKDMVVKIGNNLEEDLKALDKNRFLDFSQDRGIKTDREEQE